MIIHCTPYAPLKYETEMLALLPPARRERHPQNKPSQGAVFAYALLAYALEQAGLPFSAQTLRYTPEGKPYLPDTPIHLSISHSDTYALCALAPQPVGCDIETLRPVSDHICRRVLGADEASNDFFVHWTLKESYFKLTEDRKRPFSTIQFVLQNDGSAVAPDAYGHWYHNIPGCTAAVVAAAPFPRPLLQILPTETLFDYAAKKWG
ncbi:MAG: 4'-phosphopantetheinyl transferase superfamily protein [Oscillospiraceae bacterium]|nr:4'-phosphopantetheinyl transferase superfamily protein [Oscillospiraceae bacterium]